MSFRIFTHDIRIPSMPCTSCINVTTFVVIKLIKKIKIFFGKPWKIVNKKSWDLFYCAIVSADWPARLQKQFPTGRVRVRLSIPRSADPRVAGQMCDQAILLNRISTLGRARVAGRQERARLKRQIRYLPRGFYRDHYESLSRPTSPARTGASETDRESNYPDPTSV